MDPDLNVSRSRYTAEEREVRGFAELKKKWKRLRKEYGVQMGEVCGAPDANPHRMLHSHRACVQPHLAGTREMRGFA